LGISGVCFRQIPELPDFNAVTASLAVESIPSAYSLISGNAPLITY